MSQVFGVDENNFIHRKRATNQKDIKTSGIMGGETKAAATGLQATPEHPHRLRRLSDPIL